MVQPVAVFVKREDVENVSGLEAVNGLPRKLVREKQEDARRNRPAAGQQHADQPGELGRTAREKFPVDEERGQRVGKGIKRRRREPALLHVAG